MPLGKRAILAICAVALWLAGCQTHLSFQKTLDVPPNQWKLLHIDGPAYNQNVEVTFDASGGPVSVYICLKSQEQNVSQSLDQGKPVTNALVMSESKETGSLQAGIPAKQDFTVIVYGCSTKPATVKVKVRGLQ